MATYEQLKKMVTKFIGLGLVKEGMTSREIDTAYTKHAQNQTATSPGKRKIKKHRWGSTAAANERKLDFYQECARQIYQLQSWPEPGTDEEIRRAKELGVEISDLPFVDEAIAVGELENYKNVCSLPNQCHLPLIFYLDLYKAVFGAGRSTCDDRDQLSMLYHLARKHSVTGVEVGQALVRCAKFNWLDYPPEKFIVWRSLSDEQLLIRHMHKHHFALKLFEAGVISAAFGARYGFHLRGEWFNYDKITDNPAWDNLYNPYISLALYRGATPQEIASNRTLTYQPMQLTKKEASEWLKTQSAENPCRPKDHPSKVLLRKDGNPS